MLNLNILHLAIEYYPTGLVISRLDELHYFPAAVFVTTSSICYVCESVDIILFTENFVFCIRSTVS